MPPLIPQFNVSNNQFRFNNTLDPDGPNELNLMINIWQESVYLMGAEVYYIEREVNSAEPVFGEYLGAVLKTATHMYLQAENLSSNGGFTQPDMFSKFGLTVTDEESFKCPKRTFNRAKPNPTYNPVEPETTGPEFLPFFPKQGDLIYYVNAKKLFEVQHVEDEVELGYLFGNRNAYQLKCKAYVYSHDEISSDISIPAEVRALDHIMGLDINNNPIEIDLISQQEETKFNAPIDTSKIGIVVNTETDPLA